MDAGQVLMLSFSSVLLWSWLSVSSITKISCSASVLAYRRCLASFCLNSWLEEIWRAFFGRIDPGWWDNFPARPVVDFSTTVVVIFMSWIKALKPSRAVYVSQLLQTSGHICLVSWRKQMSVRKWKQCQNSSLLVTEEERVKSCPAIPEFSINWTTNYGTFFPQCLPCFLCTVMVCKQLKL